MLLLAKLQAKSLQVYQGGHQNFEKNPRTIPEHLYIFQEHVRSSKVSKVYVLVILRLGTLNEYHKQNNINKNMCYQQNINTCTTLSKISTAKTIFYKHKILTYLEQNKLLYL